VDSFEDALDRLDLDWWDIETIEQLQDALAFALGRPVGSELFRPSADQMAAANIYVQTRQQQITDLGFSVGQFQRGGSTITQLRDERGRFITSGASNISARLAEESG